MAEAIHSTLKPDEPYHLLGHDIGGWIAYPWAAQYPARIKSLSILDASVPGFLPRFTFPLSNADNLRLWQFSFHALPELPEILITGKEREFLTWFFQRKTVRKDVLDRFEDYIEVYERPGALSRSFEYYRAYEVSAKQNLEFARRFLQIPVMALGGEASVGEGMVGLVKGFVDGRMVEGGAIGECGHFLPEEQPDAVVERVMEFLGRNE